MANDVSYFKVPGDDNTYAFNDADLEARAAANTQDIATINSKIGTSSMGTTATTITGAIAEHEEDISALNSKTTIQSVVRADLITGINTNLTMEGHYAANMGSLTMWMMSFTPTSAISNGTTLFTMQPGYKPYLSGSTYLIIPIRSNPSPYTEVATLWINGGTGGAVVYGALSSGTRYWISCPAYLSY